MQWFANYLANLATRFVGPYGMLWFILSTVGAAILGIIGWHRSRVKEGKSGVQNWHLLLTGLGGTWIFLTIALGAAAWAVMYPASSPIPLASSAPAADEGPLQWYYNITMHGGPLSGSNVASLAFPGANISQKEVSLKSAVIRSAIDGSEVTLKVDAQSQLVPIDQINLIPPGAPVKLVAVFPKQGGLNKDEFLASWSRFNLVVKDDAKEYRVPFNEGTIAVFFPGMVGPRVTKKTQ